ncbi:MAG: tRNA pseudouridine(55) synthase TruB, partial [Haliea sp.]
MSRRRGRQISGIVVLDKPEGETSNRSLQQVKRLYQAAKAGHTGSLDPLATGVLPLCFGEATKISQFLLDSDKAYRVTIKLGIRTETGDSEGEILSQADAQGIKRKDLEAALAHFRGEIEQLPSMYSALKHQGTPLYKLARQGKSLERKRRKVTIHSLELIEFQVPELILDVHCSKGTYVRTLADDLGEHLGVGAHVTALRRTHAGPFDLSQAVTLEKLRDCYEKEGFSGIDALLLAADQAIPELPQIRLPAVTAAYMLQGQAVITRHAPTQGLVRLYNENTFICIGEVLDDGRVAPKRL